MKVVLIKNIKLISYIFILIICSTSCSKRDFIKTDKLYDNTMNDLEESGFEDDSNFSIDNNINLYDNHGHNHNDEVINKLWPYKLDYVGVHIKKEEHAGGLTTNYKLLGQTSSILIKENSTYII